MSCRLTVFNTVKTGPDGKATGSSCWLPGLPCGGGGLGGGGEGSGVANSAMGRQLNIVTGIRIKQESLQYKP